MFRLISFLLIIFYANHTYAQSYFKGNNLYEGNTAVTSAGGTTTLTIASQTVQILTGSASQNFNLPNATLMPEGRRFEFKNASTGSLVIRDTGANTLFTLLSGQSAVVWLQDNATANGTWYVEFSAVDLTSTAQVIGTLPIASGGTGQTTAPNAINALLPDQTGNAGEFLTTNGSVASWAPNPLGTVTSVGLTVPASSIFGVTGSPVTTSGDLGLTVTGTSGGIPYFDTTSTLSSSALLTDHGIVVGSGAGAAPNTIATGSAGQVLQSAGSGSDPAWSTATYPGTAGNTGTLLQSNGTNFVNTTATYPATSGNAGSVLVSGGTNFTSTNIDLADSDAVGATILGVANGGTGQSTYTNGQLLIGNTTGNTLTKATLTAGNGVVITNGGGSITIGQTSGTYTPSNSGCPANTNVDSVTFQVTRYYRVGNMVTVSGFMSVDPTTTLVDINVYFNAPIASAFTTTGQNSGNCNIASTDSQVYCAMSNEATNDCLRLLTNTAATASRSFFFQSTYEVF